MDTVEKISQTMFPTHEDNELIDTLGAWTDDARDQWKWFYLPSTQRDYQQPQQGWKVFSKQHPQGQIQKGTLFHYES